MKVCKAVARASYWKKYFIRKKEKKCILKAISHPENIIGELNIGIFGSSMAKADALFQAHTYIHKQYVRVNSILNNFVRTNLNFLKYFVHIKRLDF